MYERFDIIASRARYKGIVNETVLQTADLVERFPEINMYKSIYDQIDIKKSVIDNDIKFTEDEMRERYSLRAIAGRNFDLEHGEYAQKLSDIFGGADVYPTLEYLNNLASSLIISFYHDEKIIILFIFWRMRNSDEMDCY